MAESCDVWVIGMAALPLGLKFKQSASLQGNRKSLVLGHNVKEKAL
jgi:hypothetical protein